MNPLYNQLIETFNLIDIYWFDQLLKGRIAPGQRVLDAGFGGGRNSHFLLQSGVEVYGIDPSAEALVAIRELLAGIAPEYPVERFRQEAAEEQQFPDHYFDAICCSAVLHFARNPEHFKQMVTNLWRSLKPGGLLFARFATRDGLEGHLETLGNGWYRLPDGTERYLASLQELEAIRAELGAFAADDLKTVMVHGKRTMTNWVLGKSGATSQEQP